MDQRALTWRAYLLVTLAALAVILSFAIFQHAPGYMDAEYYYGMGLRIAKSHTLAEPFVWNYLDHPLSITHNGFTFWMPLTSFFVAAGMRLSGLFDFQGARVMLVLVAVMIPALTMRLALAIEKDRRTAILAGIMALMPFLYGPFLTTTDSFGLVMLLGGAFFLLGENIKGPGGFILLGVIAGLMHLARADGVLWVAAGVLVVFLKPVKKMASGAALFLGYLLVMSFWFGRNWLEFGEIMPGGSAGMFWLREYNDLFSLYPENLNFRTWADQGLGIILGVVARAVFANLKTTLLVQGEIIFLPLVVLGVRKDWEGASAKVFTACWLAVFLVMSFIFPFAGMRGGMFHSGAALQPLAWVYAASGFSEVMQWGVAKRGWVKAKAWTMFGAALVVCLVGLSAFALIDRVIGKDVNHPVWDASYQEYLELESSLEALGILPGEIVLINNPPGFFAATGRSSVVIPNGGLGELLAAAKRYQVRYAVLDQNLPVGLTELYAFPEDAAGLEYLGTEHGFKIFRIKE
jgi:hypothetical protein